MLVGPLLGRCGHPVLIVISGRPVIITSSLDRVDAAVAAWLPGTVGEGVADALFGDVPFTGSMPSDWPWDLPLVPTLPAGQSSLFRIGHGLTD